MESLGFVVTELGFKDQGDWGLGYRAGDLRFWVQRSGFGLKGQGLRV